LYTGIGLLHLVAEPFRYREARWRQQMENLLTHVEAILGGISPARSSRRAAVGDFRESDAQQAAEPALIPTNPIKMTGFVGGLTHLSARLPS
jgi:hypothetical protein